jgi:hypothetical protein
MDGAGRIDPLRARTVTGSATRFLATLAATPQG